MKERKKLFFGELGRGRGGGVRETRSVPGVTLWKTDGQTNTCVWVMGEVMMTVRLGKE